MGDRNRHGLGRHIPEAVKLKVRQNSNFGCVNCRMAVYEFEHFEPDFKDATRHDPEGIALLCPTCHTLVTKGRIPKSEIAKKYQQLQSQSAPNPPRDNEFFQHYSKQLNIQLGPSLFSGVHSIINLDGIDVLSYAYDRISERYTVSGEFYNSNGQQLFRIENNEWIGPTDVWDVQQKGRTLTIKSDAENIIFSATKDNENHLLIIDRLDMFLSLFHIHITPTQLLIGQYSEDLKRSVYYECKGDFSGGQCAVFLNSSATKEPKVGNLKMVGGEGSWIEGTGIWLGFGTQSAHVRSFRVFNNGCEIMSPQQKAKSIQPAVNQHYFVTGVLESEVTQYPKWTKTKYFLNGQSLDSKPNSWGTIDKLHDKPVELFYISRGEAEDLALNSGFVGFHADDVLGQSWADRVFEAEVADKDESGNVIVQRVKIADIDGRKVLSDLERPLFPQMFAGCSPWKSGVL